MLVLFVSMLVPSFVCVCCAQHALHSITPVSSASCLCSLATLWQSAECCQLDTLPLRPGVPSKAVCLCAALQGVSGFLSKKEAAAAGRPLAPGVLLDVVVPAGGAPKPAGGGSSVVNVSCLPEAVATAVSHAWEGLNIGALWHSTSVVLHWMCCCLLAAQAPCWAVLAAVLPAVRKLLPCQRS